jgi:hypothetical protein
MKHKHLGVKLDGLPVCLSCACEIADGWSHERFWKQNPPQMLDVTVECYQCSKRIDNLAARLVAKNLDLNAQTMEGE